MTATPTGMDRRPTDRPADLPPAIILGGNTIALAAARSLGARGIRVFVLDSPGSYARHSRYTTWIPLDSGVGIAQPEEWHRWLIEEGAQRLPGAVLIPGSDNGLEVLSAHYDELRSLFRPVEMNPAVVSGMLDKARSTAMARSAGIECPREWIVASEEELERAMAEAEYPCMVKPFQTFKLMEHTDGVKLFIVRNRAQLLDAVAVMDRLGLEYMIHEIVPGGEEGYCSYYTYLDERGEPLLHFTKRKLRQYPVGRGIGTFHCTDWDPAVAEAGLALFREIGLRGLGNVEFKRDPRDGRLKFIECNLRITLVTELIVAAGLDLPMLLYARAAGLPPPATERYRKGLCTVTPIVDFLAYRQLRKRGEISTYQWIRSLLRPMRFLHFRWSDPAPTLARFVPFVRKQLARLGGPRVGEGQPAAAASKITTMKGA